MRALLFIAILTVMAGFACADAEIQHDVTTDAKPWTSLALNNDPDVFRFAVVSDNAGGPRWGIFAEAMAKLNLLQPEFVITTGDLIEGYEDTPELLNKQWDRFTAERDILEMPFFHVPGNHDHGRSLWSEVYNARFGVPYYHFVYKNVLFLCLATNTAPDYGTGISREQVDYVARVLAEHKDVRWTLAFQHKPLWNDDNAEWKEIEQHLQGRNVTVFAGHTHNYLHQERNGISFITLAATGGGSALRGPAYGEFDQIAWVTMTKDGPRVANLLLDGIYDKNLRDEQTASELALFRRDAAVKATPLQLDGPQLESAVSKLAIMNPAKTPMRVKVLTETTPGVRVEPGTVAAIIPPGGTHEVNLHVTADAPVPAPQAQPIVLHWTANYDSDANTRSTEIKGQTRICVNAPFTIAPATNVPVIDGKLGDWAELPYVVNQPADVYTTLHAWKGPQDGSFRFGVSRDADFLYVAVKTFDDERCFDGWKYWEDFVMVLIDGRASEKDDPRTSIFGLMAGPELDASQVEEYSVGQAPDGVQRASTATEEGIEAEFAIPLASINALQGGDWQHVRINVAFSDFDRGDSRDGPTILYWRPQWERRPEFQSSLFTKE